MPNPAFFKEAFDRIATDGAIGDPNGLEAVAYLRVSSDKQADEGRTGLPRQITHIHEAALRDGYSILWENIFADDESGFTLDRPALNEMLGSVGTTCPNVVVIEHLDRLSRDADWHQGYLLYLLQKKCNAQVIFWKQFSSRVERMVLGAVSQDGMERTKDNMREGKLLKAQSGRVTAGPRVAFGYKKVALSGFANEPINVQRQTTYDFCDDPVKIEIVHYIFEGLAFKGKTTLALSRELNDLYPPPGDAKCWDRSYIAAIVRNTVYKGMFAHGRFKKVTATEVDPITGVARKTTRVTETPESEWILVPVPAMVSTPVWEAANKQLAKNIATATRNQNRFYLLSGMLVCAQCGLSWHASQGSAANGGKHYYYGCNSKTMSKYRKPLCPSRKIRLELLDDAVWNVVRDVLMHPDLLTAYLDERFEGDENQKINDRIEYLQSEIRRIERDDRRALELYNVGGYTPEEYKEIHLGFKAEIKRHNQLILELQTKYITREQIQEQKEFILAMTAQARQYNLGENPPDDIRRALIKIACDRIVVNEPEGTFTIEGEINGTWPIVLARAAGYDGGDDIVSGSPT